MTLSNFKIILFSSIPIGIIIGPTISTLFIASIIFICFFEILKKKKFETFYNKDVLVLFIINIYLIINLILSKDFENSAIRNLGFIRYVLFAISTIYIFIYLKNSQKIFKIWTITILVVLLDIYIEFIFGRNILGFSGPQGSWGSRIVSFFKDEQVAGTFIFTFIIVIIGYLLESYKSKRALVIILFLIIFSVIGIALTGERSSLIKCLFAILFILFFTNRLNIKKKIIFFLFILFSLTVVINSSKFLKTRFEGQFLSNFYTIEKFQKFKNESLYVKLYRGGLKIYEENKIFGVGNKNYSKECFNTFNLEYKINKKLNYICSTHPHQIYFEFLSEHGIFGTLILLISIFFIIFNNIKIYIKKRNNIHLGCIAYTISMFLPFLPSGSFFSNFNSTMFFINFCLMIAFSRINFKSKIYK